MELSFATILMEAAMKMSSLTDASVFMLVETHEGRRFTGKRHLCDSYIRGDFSASDRDLEIVVNPGVSSVDLRPCPRPQFDTAVFNQGVHLGGSPNQTGLQPHTPPAPRHSRKRSFNGDVSRGFSRPDFIPSKLARSAAVFPSPVKVEDNGDIVSIDTSNSGDIKALGDAPYDNEDHDDLQIVQDEDPPPNHFDSFSEDIEEGQHLGTLSRSGSSKGDTAPRRHFPSPSSMAQPTTLTSLPSYPTELTEVTVSKIQAVKEFSLMEILTKGSAANKLLSSLLYDVVKNISKICAELGYVSAKEASAKDVFYALLEKFVKENFPELLTTDIMFYEGSNRMSALAYIRSKTRVMFFMRMKALNKNQLTT